MQQVTAKIYKIDILVKYWLSMSSETRKVCCRLDMGMVQGNASRPDKNQVYS